MKMPTAMFAFEGNNWKEPYVYIMYGCDLRLLFQDAKPGKAIREWKDENDRTHEQPFQNSRHYTQFAPWRNLDRKLGASGPVDIFVRGQKVHFLLEPSPRTYHLLTFDPANGKTTDGSEYKKLTGAAKKEEFTVTGACLVQKPDSLLLLGLKGNKPHWCVWDMHQDALDGKVQPAPSGITGRVETVLSGYHPPGEDSKVLRLYWDNNGSAREYACTAAKSGDNWTLTHQANAAEFLRSAEPQK